jgi:glycosyltransferase involved in cell wall biosynthesis
MRIAIFSDSFTQLNGVATHIRNIAEKLTRRGHEVTVYTGSGISDKFKVVNLPKLPFVFSPGYELIIPRPVHVDADVVHVHTVYSAGWIGITEKRPRVVTTHTLPKHIFPYNWLSFLRPLGWKYLISIYNRANHAVCQTERTAEMFREHGLKIPISIISAGVDVDFFKRGNAKRFREKYRIDDEFVLSTARLSPEKRPEFALRACRELGLKIALTSSGPLKEKLRQKYPEAIFSITNISREDLKDIYAAAKVFVLTSAPGVESEGLGSLEAMCSGVPVVCSDVPHIVKDGENGFLFGNYEEFKRKLGTLWRDEELRGKFIKNGRKTAEERNIERVVDKLIGVYKTLL